MTRSMETSTVIWASADIARDLNLEITGAAIDGVWVSFSRGDGADVATLYSDNALVFNVNRTSAADYRALLGIASYHNLELIEVHND